MKFNVKELQKACNSAAMACEKKSGLPAYRMLQLVTNKGVLYVKGCSGPVEIIERAESIEGDIKCSVLNHMLIGTLGLLRGETAKMEVKERKNGTTYLFISDGPGKNFKLDCDKELLILDREDPKDVEPMTVDTIDFISAIRRVQPGMSSNEFEPQFSGINIEPDGKDQIKIMGTNRTIIMVQTITVKGEPCSMVIPKNVIGSFGAMYGEGEMEIKNGKNAVSVKGPNGVIMRFTKLADKPIPLPPGIIELKRRNVVQVSMDDAKLIGKATTIFSRREVAGDGKIDVLFPISMSIDNKIANVVGKSEFHNSNAEVSIDLVRNEGVSEEICVNAVYWITAIAALGDVDNVDVLVHSSENKPIMIRKTGDDQNYLYTLIGQMTINDERTSSQESSDSPA